MLGACCGPGPSSILVCPPATGVIVYLSCSERPKFSKAPHFPRSQGLWAVMAQGGGPSVRPHLWPSAPSPPGGLGIVPVGTLEGRPGQGCVEAPARPSSRHSDRSAAWSLSLPPPRPQLGVCVLCEPSQGRWCVHLFFLNICLFIWLCWVLVVACRIFVAASRIF